MHLGYRKGKEAAIPGGAPSLEPEAMSSFSSFSLWGFGGGGGSSSNAYSNDKTKGSRWIVSARRNRRVLTYTIM